MFHKCAGALMLFSRSLSLRVSPPSLPTSHYMRKCSHFLNLLFHNFCFQTPIMEVSAKPKKEKELKTLFKGQIDELANGSTLSLVVIPSSLKAKYRKELKSYAEGLQLKTETDDTNQCFVYKYDSDIPLKLFEESKQSIAQMITTDNNALHPEVETQIFEHRNPFKKAKIPPAVSYEQRMHQNRRKLPIFESRNAILNQIDRSQVVVISSETGSGKSTQVPQYILEDCSFYNKGCRIVVTQPRCLAATSIAARIAEERGEQLGGIVGYQIRHDSCVSPDTNLILCTK